MMSIMFLVQNVHKPLSHREATKPLAKLLGLYADSILSSQLLWALCVETGQTCEGASLPDLTRNQLFVPLFSFGAWNSLSSSSSAGGRAEGICWISRRVSSLVCSGPSCCSCCPTQVEVKPPSSSPGLVGVMGTAGDTGAQVQKKPISLINSGGVEM